ncbi:MAG: hypothetical protein PHR56_08530 [Dehalococcoidales bacterium]|nr:hypothetical protein [Dehalococcoidales bacterium]
MLFKINCPSCGTETSFSFRELDYKGPFRCWKCRGTFTIRIENRKLTSWEPLSADDFAKVNKLNY